MRRGAVVAAKTAVDAYAGAVADGRKAVESPGDIIKNVISRHF